ncbi:hypothetical protein FPZ54_04705 [Sphingomonas suaedae]|uniref:DUF333 domain-containing protein n=1 Tax=Sphingomonas suaedae TaxID=2599297 RepID=A0A518RD66_9SPHN|nr:hypothetical protein [Sphingomonas suaedae]QDX25392.1 hypothetical protein FPZ54_04705 [Sphingomonas suaedae]
MKTRNSIAALALAMTACSTAPEPDNGAQDVPAPVATAVVADPTPTPSATPAPADATLAVAVGKRAKCAISHGGYDDDGNPTKGDSYEGPCLFRSEKGGHFTVSREGDQPFWTGEDPVTTVSVGVSGENAQVTGMTKDGMARWGYATRLDSDRACWSGDAFTVCAW